MLSIAYKNIKGMIKNPFLIIFLTIIPIFLIGIIKSMVDKSEGFINGASSLVEVIILSKSKESILLQSFSATLLVQFLLLGSMVAGAMLVGEREKNTLIRMFAAPIKKSEMLMGILIGHSTIVFLICFLIIMLSNLIFKVSWGNSWINVFIVTIFAVYVATSLALIISGIFKSTKVAGTVSSFIVIFMTFASGGFTAGKGFKGISKFTINKWIADAYLKLMEGGNIHSIKVELLILAIMGTVFMIIASAIYRKENIYE